MFKIINELNPGEQVDSPPLPVYKSVLEVG